MASQGTIPLPRGFGNLDTEQTYFVAYPVFNTSRYWNHFQSRILKGIQETNSISGSPEHLLEAIYNSALKNSSGPPYSPLHMQQGYLYPTVGYNKDTSLIIQSLVDGTYLDVVYPSNRVVNSGKSSMIERIYMGRVHSISEDKKYFTLKIGSEFRTFSLEKVRQLDSFGKRVKAFLRHMKLTFSIDETGAMSLTWEHIDNESSELLAKPWDPNAKAPIPQIVQFAPKAPKKKLLPSSSERSVQTVEPGAISSFSVENLVKLRGNLLLIKAIEDGEETSSTLLRLSEFELDSKVGRVKLFGEGGALFKGAVGNFQISDLGVGNDEQAKKTPEAPRWRLA